MTLETFIRAQLVAFADHQVGDTKSVNCLKAICFAMLNRQRAGWSNDMLQLIDQAPESAAHDPNPDPGGIIITPAIIGLLRDIDDIFFGQNEDETRKAVGKCLYWQNLLNKDLRPWFVENIVRQPAEHPRKAQVGMLVLYE